MKKTIILMLFVFITMNCMAQRFSYIYKGVTFRCKVEKTGGVCITLFDADADKVVIPAKVSHEGKSYLVKRINTFINGHNYLATSLTIEEGVEQIEAYAFNEFRKLKEVVLPSTIREVGKNAFRENEGMTFCLASALMNEADLRNGKGLVVSEEVIFDGNRLLADSGLAQLKAAEAEQVRQEQESVRLEKENQENLLALSEEERKLQNEQTLLNMNVDKNIPRNTRYNTNTYCVIVANENYTDVPKVDYALNDDRIFKEYCIKTLGIPEKRILTFLDASYTDMKRAISFMQNAAKVTQGKGKLIFYYAGHGMPNDQDKAAYLVPTDAYPKDISTCFKLRDLYQQLGKLNVVSCTVLLDACFSGVQRGREDMLVAGRGVAYAPDEDELTGNVVVLSAASKEETAHAYDKHQHGMFTYFLLNKLAQTKGKANLEELFKFVNTNVMQASFDENQKLQTPSVSASDAMSDKWKEVCF